MKSILRLSFILLLALSCKAQSTIIQSTLVEQEKQLIIGTWIVDNGNTNKWIFTSNNKCKWISEGNVLKKFTYSIDSEFSPNGVEHTFVKLYNVTNPNEIYEYEINGLSDVKMLLETIHPKVSYTYFTRE